MRTPTKCVCIFFFTPSSQFLNKTGKICKTYSKVLSRLRRHESSPLNTNQNLRKHARAFKMFYMRTPPIEHFKAGGQAEQVTVSPQLYQGRKN